MTQFEKQYFKQFQFTQDQVDRYVQNAQRDLEIARKDAISEVKFNYSYQTLIKAGIALLAKVGNVKIRSVPGHHMKILSKMAEILDNEEVFVIGNTMRMKRNLDFYGGGEFISEKEASEFFEFVEKVVREVKLKC